MSGGEFQSRQSNPRVRAFRSLVLLPFLTSPTLTWLTSPHLAPFSLIYHFVSSTLSTYVCSVLQFELLIAGDSLQRRSICSFQVAKLGSSLTTPTVYDGRDSLVSQLLVYFQKQSKSRRKKLLKRFSNSQPSMIDLLLCQLATTHKLTVKIGWLASYSKHDECGHF